MRRSQGIPSHVMGGMHGMPGGGRRGAVHALDGMRMSLMQSPQWNLPWVVNNRREGQSRGVRPTRAR